MWKRANKLQEKGFYVAMRALTCNINMGFSGVVQQIPIFQ